MPNERPTGDVCRPPAAGRGRRYLSAEEILPAAASSSCSQGIPEGPEGGDLQSAREGSAPPAGAVAGGGGPVPVHEELARLARESPYVLGEMVARGAESVLYRATAGQAVFCAKAIRNLLGLTFRTAGAETEDGKIEASYQTKVRHLRNEYAVGMALQQPGDIPIVRLYALRKVCRLRLEMGYDLLMELIDGTDMGNRQFVRGLSPAERVRILYQTAQALNFMHRRGYVHLDMKPSNVMVTQQRVKLIDFGVTVTRGHRPLSLAGTAGFLSPEQIVREPLTEATDIFALGVTFGVIFGGRPLRQSVEDLTRKAFRSEAQYHLENVDQPAMVEMPDLAPFPAVARVLADCTVPRRDKRIGTSAALLDRLERAAAEHGIRLPAPRP